MPKICRVPDQYDPAWFRALRESPPDVFLIDLSHRPAHGRDIAIYLRGQKSVRHIPIVFLDGPPEKVEAIRKVLPDAVYASSARMKSAVRQAVGHRPAHPVVPMQMRERYASRTAAQKLGISADAVVGLIEPPRNYANVIGSLPDGARYDEIGGAGCAVTLWFVADAATLREALPEMRHLVTRTKLWLLWRKGGKGVTQPLLREYANAVGLVDYKICAVNEMWSAMLFARKKLNF